MHSVEVRGVSPSKTDDYGFTALHHAASNGACRRATRLPLDLPVCFSIAHSQYHSSSAAGHASIVAYLLAARADVNASACGCTALHRAAFRGHAAIADALLRAGASLNAVDSSTGDGRAPLAKAASQGHVDVVELILRYAKEVGAVAECLDAKDARGQTAVDVTANEQVRQCLKAAAAAQVPP
jgi:ankyrin repeat protein